MKLPRIGWAGWLGIIGAAWILLRATRPAWYQDLMLRTFGADVPAKGTQEAQLLEAADLAAKYMLPLGWVVRIGEVATGVKLEDAVKSVSDKVIKMGPPADTRPETLATYKETALAAAKGA